MAGAGWRRRLQGAALRAFRGLPGPVKRRLVSGGTPNYTLGAVCVLVHDEHVLLLGQPHRPGLSLPGGLLDRGEGPETAVAREVAEEVGLRVDAGDPVMVAVHPDGHAVDVVYRVRLRERPEIRLDNEARTFAWRHHSELEKGEVDATTRRILRVCVVEEHQPRAGALLPARAGGP